MSCQFGTSTNEHKLTRELHAMLSMVVTKMSTPHTVYGTPTRIIFGATRETEQ